MRKRRRWRKRRRRRGREEEGYKEKFIVLFYGKKLNSPFLHFSALQQKADPLLFSNSRSHH